MGKEIENRDDKNRDDKNRDDKKQGGQKKTGGGGWQNFFCPPSFLPKFRGLN